MTACEPIIDLIDRVNARHFYPQGATLLRHQAVSAGIGLAYYHHPPIDLPESTCRQHLILINTHVPADTRVEQVTEGKYQVGNMKNEDVIIIPAQVTHAARWDQEHTYLAIAFEPEVFEQRLGEAISGHAIKLVPQFLRPDPLIHGIGKALQAESESAGLGGTLYVESLITTLSAHLLRHYSTQTARQPTIDGLPKYRLRQVMDYIHAHLDRDIGLAELAAIAQVSPNYFATQFKRSMGFAPYQYVIHCRVERAKELIANGTAIADVAYQLGFTHQSHLTRHFKRLVGVTPKQFFKQQ